MVVRKPESFSKTLRAIFEHLLHPCELSSVRTCIQLCRQHNDEKKKSTQTRNTTVSLPSKHRFKMIDYNDFNKYLEL